MNVFNFGRAPWFSFVCSKYIRKINWKGKGLDLRFANLAKAKLSNAALGNVNLIFHDK